MHEAGVPLKRAQENERTGNVVQSWNRSGGSPVLRSAPQDMAQQDVGIDRASLPRALGSPGNRPRTVTGQSTLPLVPPVNSGSFARRI